MDILLVDNDAPTRAQIEEFCRRADNVRIVGEAETGAKSLIAAAMLRPDLLLIAAKLPDMTGFDLLRALHRRHQRRSILITGDARDGASAIDGGAFGYMVKPLAETTFSAFVSRAHQTLRLRATGPRAALTGPASPGPLQDADPARPAFLVGERERRLYPLEPEQIDYVESAGNYVKYHLVQLSYIARESIKRLEVMLAPIGFIRIERSLLLNIRAIAYVQPTGRGTFAFTLTCGARLHSGYAYRDVILSALPLRRRVPKREKLPEAAQRRVVALRTEPKSRSLRVAIR